MLGPANQEILMRSRADLRLGIPIVLAGKKNDAVIAPIEVLSQVRLDKLKLIDNDNKEHFGGIAVNVGNQHVIFFLENIENINLSKIGPEIENNEIFPERCNVTLAKIINKNLIKVKVWERGAGLTKACGTAACATALAANQKKLSNSKTYIEFKLGKLLINIDDFNRIQMIFNK